MTQTAAWENQSVGGGNLYVRKRVVMVVWIIGSDKGGRSGEPARKRKINNEKKGKTTHSYSSGANYRCFIKPCTSEVSFGVHSQL